MPAPRPGIQPRDKTRRERGRPRAAQGPPARPGPTPAGAPAAGKGSAPLAAAKARGPSQPEPRQLALAAPPRLPGPHAARARHPVRDSGLYAVRGSGQERGERRGGRDRPTHAVPVAPRGDPREAAPADPRAHRPAPVAMPAARPAARSPAVPLARAEETEAGPARFQAPPNVVTLLLSPGRAAALGLSV